MSRLVGIVSEFLSAVYICNDGVLSNTEETGVDIAVAGWIDARPDNTCC